MAASNSRTFTRTVLDAQLPNNVTPKSRTSESGTNRTEKYLLKIIFSVVIPTSSSSKTKTNYPPVSEVENSSGCERSLHPYRFLHSKLI